MWNDILIKILEDGLFAAIAAIGFSGIGNTPRRAYLTCGLIAAIGHSIRFVLTLPEFGAMHIIPASTAASFAIGVLAVLLASRIKCPAEVCFFPALLPMIPGMYAYRTAEALLSCLYHTQEKAFVHYFYLLTYNGFTCVFIILGMVIGATIPVFLFKKLSFAATR
ncbi:MAG: threonine/serine exporter family protein [Prevotellaceae bacterium]|nr:threonine/serine exporter family protein [Prevotella sp.]MDD7258572.1 threonine/serine exporter family protein [Prevotellaceae bacterium]MDY6131482.1 threonine/serine exporter family protein [Prevotella sp.]